MKQENGSGENISRYKTCRPSTAIRFNFVSQWRKSQLGVGAKSEREGEKNKYLYKTRTAMQQNPADVGSASSITEIARLIMGIAVRHVVVCFSTKHKRDEKEMHIKLQLNT
jgi:hypothetical protein